MSQVLFPLHPKAGTTGAVPAIVVPATLGQVPGSVVDCDDGSGWQLFNTAVLATALAITTATTARAIQTTNETHSQHQEIVASTARGSPAYLSPQDSAWPASSTTPRFTYLWSDEVIVPQPTVRSEEYEVPQVVVPAVRSTFVFEWQDEVVSIRLEEGTWEPPYIPRPIIAFPADPQTDEIVPAVTPTAYGDTAGLTFTFWAAPSTTPRIIQFYADDVIVPQPTAVVDELYASPPIVVVPATVVLPPAPVTDTVVPQPTGVVDEVYVWPIVPEPPDTYVNVPVPWQYAYGDGILQGSQVTEDYEYRAFVVAKVSVPEVVIADEVIVAQPTATRDEMYGWPPQVVVLVAPQTAVSNTTDEVVPQPTAVVDEVYDITVAVVVPARTHTTVHNTDEVVGQQSVAVIEEMYAWPLPVVVLVAAQTAVYNITEEIVAQPIAPPDDGTWLDWDARPVPQKVHVFYTVDEVFKLITHTVDFTRTFITVSPVVASITVVPVVAIVTVADDITTITPE
jgi:hypothetical protein